jgi:DNA-directed RNA polymerase subunit M/transcription elongation factor TFIIS
MYALLAARKQNDAAWKHLSDDNLASYGTMVDTALSCLDDLTRHFYVQDIVHYLKPEEVAQGVIPPARDQAVFEELARQRGAGVLCAPQRQQQQQVLVEPQAMYNTEAGGDACANPKCQSTNTLLVPIQTRSADEPTSYYFQCVECNHRWRVG